MDKIKRLLPRVIVGIMIVVLAVGMVFFVSDSRKGDGSKNKKLNGDGELVTLDDIPGKMDQHTLLLKASQANNGLVDASSDYYQSFCWNVYYDGTVEYCENYNLSGRTTTVTWELTDEQFSRLVELLQGDFFKYKEDYESACDGATWHYTYYALDETKVHSYNGYNYSVPTLLEISEILDSDKRDLVEIVPVEKSDSHTVMFEMTKEYYAADANEDVIIFSNWTLYYDGWVELQNTYQLSGKQSVVTWELDDTTYRKFVQNMELFQNTNYDDIPTQEDDYYYAMTYYDEDGNEIHTAKTVEIKNDILSTIIYQLTQPDEGYSYLDDEADTGAWNSMNYTVGEYTISISSINPGHPDSNNVMFSTYFDWQDTEETTTTIDMEYVFEERNINDVYSLEHLTPITIGDKEYYYLVLEMNQVWLYYINDDNSYMMILLEINSRFDAEGSFADYSDVNLEEVLQEDIIEEAMDFQIDKK